MEIDKKSIILFIPEAGIYPYLRSLSILGAAAVKNEEKVYITHCTGQMSRCPMMTTHRLPVAASLEEKNRLCKICQKRFKSVQKQYNFSVIELKDLINKAEIQLVENLSNITQDSLEKLMFKNIAVGEISKYDFSLETKTQIYPNLSEGHKSLYIAYIKNTILAVSLSENICLNYNPSVFITFNQYAQCQGVRAAAAIHNVNFFAVTLASHKNVDTAQLILYEKLNTFSVHCLKWYNIKNIPILPPNVSECWDDIFFHFYGSGSHIFSSSKRGNPEYIFKKFVLNTKKKLIVVYTSSNDERNGYEKLLKIWKENTAFIDAFPNQIDWLSWLRDYSTQHKDVQIIVRIHPREGSRQFGFGSNHLKQLRMAFPANTESFFVVWPDDPMSSYDLMELADLCLVSWSTMGQEAARLGIPTLAYTGGMFYPDDDFIQVATTPEEYKKRLDSMINFKFTWQHLIKAVRFYHWRTFIPSLDLSETVPSDFEDNSVWPEAPASKVGIINDILSGKQDLIEYNIKQWQVSLPVDAEFQEAEAMRQGIRYFLDKIFYPPITYGKNIDRLLYISGKVWRKYLRRYWYKFIIRKNPLIKKSSYAFTDYTLEFTIKISQLEKLRQKTKKDKKLRIIIADGLYAVLIHRGRALRRMSPVVVRLAKLYSDSLIKQSNV